MAHTRTAKLFLLWGLTALSIPYMQGQEKRMTTVYLTSDCVDSVEEIARRQRREKLEVPTVIRWPQGPRRENQASKSS